MMPATTQLAPVPLESTLELLKCKVRVLLLLVMLLLLHCFSVFALRGDATAKPPAHQLGVLAAQPILWAAARVARTPLFIHGAVRAAKPLLCFHVTVTFLLPRSTRVRAVAPAAPRKHSAIVWAGCTSAQPGLGLVPA